MKRFEYSMQRLLDAREAAVDAAKSGLARARIELQQEWDKRDALMDKRAEVIKRLDGKRSRAGASDIVDIHAYLASLKRQIARKACDIKDAETGLERKRIALNHALGEQRKLEELRDRERTVWDHSVRRETQAIMDEVASVANQRDATRAA